MNILEFTSRFELLGLTGFIYEINLLLALYKSGKKSYLLEEKEEVIDLAISYFYQAIEGFRNDQETQKTGIYTLTKEAVKAEKTYGWMSLGLKSKDEIETLIPQYIKILERTKAGEDIELKEIDNLMRFFKTIASKIEKKLHESPLERLTHLSVSKGALSCA